MISVVKDKTILVDRLVLDKSIKQFLQNIGKKNTLKVVY